MEFFQELKNIKPLPAPLLAEASFVAGSNHSLQVYTDESLYKSCGTRIAFTTRNNGVSQAPYLSLNLGTHVDDDPQAVLQNRQILLDAFGLSCDVEDLLVPNQVHGTHIVSVDNVDITKLEIEAGCDGIICAKPLSPVLLCFADCVPVICVAPNGDFAVLHAGWRGALSGIVGKGLSVLCDQRGFHASECNIYVGPHIGPECFEVNEDIYTQFLDRYGAACDAGYRHIDLAAAIKTNVLENKADAARFIVSAQCTVCNLEEFFSYRGEQGVTGRHGAFAVKEA